MKCNLCEGTGFYKGQICECIKRKEPELPKEFMEIFGDMFSGAYQEPKEDKTSD